MSNIGAGPFFGGLYWQRIKIGYVFQPNWEATVGLGMSWGPRIYTAEGPISLVDADGDLTFNASGFKLAGSLSFLGDEWGKGSVEYKAGAVTATAELGRDWEFKSKDGKNALEDRAQGHVLRHVRERLRRLSGEGRAVLRGQAVLRADLQGGRVHLPGCRPRRV